MTTENTVENTTIAESIETETETETIGKGTAINEAQPTTGTGARQNNTSIQEGSNTTPGRSGLTHPETDTNSGDGTRNKPASVTTTENPTRETKQPFGPYFTRKHK